MGEWIETILSKIADVRDGTHDSPKQSLQGFPLITSRHIKGRSIDFPNTYLISKEDYESINKRSKVDKWDILFSMIGTIGAKTLIDFEPYFAIKNVGLFKFRNELDARWVYYYLDSGEAKEELEARLKGSTQQFIALGDLRSFPIKKPKEKLQKAIVEVLSSLDDKIDLLHKQNKTLESLAETLFRQYFIENAQDDWEVTNLGDLISISSGKSLKRSEFDDFGKYKVLGANGEIGRANQFNFNERLLFTGRVGTLGNVFIVNEPVWLSDNTLVVKPNKPELFYFVYFILKNAELQTLNVGSTQPLIRQSEVKEIEIYLPTTDNLISFHEILETQFSKIEENKRQIIKLETLRDTLLPKLMNGDVRVEV